MALVVVLSALPDGSAAAVSPQKRLTQLSVRRFGLEQGLPTISVGALAQDAEGTLWIGTGEGLVRFDGFDFTVLDRRNTPAFASNEVASLAFDPEGTLWIGMADGWLCRRRRGVIERVERIGSFPAMISRDGPEIVVASRGRPFRRVGEHLTPYSRIPDAIPEHLTGAILTDDSGDTWVGSLDAESLTRFRGGVRVPLPAFPGFPGGYVQWLGADGRGGFWTAGAGGLHHVRRDRVDLLVRTGQVGAGSVHGLAVDSEGCVFLSFAVRGGFARRCGKRLESVDSRSGLGAERVTALLLDPDGSLWAGTWDAGLIQLLDGPFSVLGAAEGLAVNEAMTFLETRDGALLIGTPHGLCRVEGSTIRCAGSAEGLAEPSIRSLAEADDGTIYVGTSAGLYRRTGGRFLPCTPSGVAPAPVLMLHRDRRGAIWARIGDELFRIESGITSAVRCVGPPYAMVEDAAGELWVATAAGIGKVDRRSSSIARFDTPLPETRSIFMSAFADRKGRLWFGSYQGGALVGPPGGPFRLVTTREGLPDDNALGIADDLQGRIWITGGRRLVSIDEAEIDEFLAGRSSRLKCRTWGRRHGLKSLELHGGAGVPALRARDGKLWFASSAGAIYVEPERLGAETAPPAYLSRFLVDGENAMVGDGASAVRIPPGQHRLELGWSARHRLEPESVLFRRRLVGFDHRWVVSDPARRAEYTHLDPGRYRFEVEASFDGEAWGAPAALEVEVEAFWYETTAGRASLVLAALLVVGAVVRDRLSRAKARAEHLEAEVAERSGQLLQAEREIRRRREMEPLVDFGNRVSGLLDPEAVLDEAAKTLAGRAGEGPRLLVAAREGSPALVRGTGPRPSPDEAEELVALIRDDAVPSQLVLDRDDRANQTAAASRLAKAGLEIVAPLRGGDSVFGFVACGLPRGDDEGLAAFVAALAAHTGSALQGAWQAAEAARWRRVSDARVEWMTLDPVARVVYAVAARMEAALCGERIVSAVLEAFGEHQPNPDVVRSAVRRMQESGVLDQRPDGCLAIARADWLLLPELRRPLAELARDSLQRVGAYRLLERIGAGGMGEVYRAVNAHDGSPAAVKLLFEGDSACPEARRRLEREGEIIAAIRHPAVVRFLERGEHLGRLYFAMELLDGEPLAERLGRGRLPEADVIELARQVFSALSCLHDAGIVHRDVTPANVFSCRDGRFVLLDMGLARGLDHSTLTRTRQLLGTLPYMSPEQLRGEEADARSDLWSAGMVLHQAFSGSLPWEGQNTVRMALEILRAQEAAPPVGVAADSVLKRVLAACLQGDREKRAPSAAALLDLLGEGSPS